MLFIQNKHNQKNSPKSGNCLAGWIFLFLLLYPLSNQAYSQIGGLLNSSEHVKVTATAQRNNVVPGADVPVAVVFDHDPNWHIHTNAPQVPPEMGDASLYVKTQVKAKTSEDHPVKVHTPFLQWPEPQTIEVAFTGESVPYDVFSGKAIAYVPVSISPDAEPGEVKLTLYVTYQACDDMQCLAPVNDQPVAVNFIVHDSDEAFSQSRAAESELFSGFDASVWQKIHEGQQVATQVMFDLFGGSFEISPESWFGFILLLAIAALGGFLLNMTPCVLPVIPIKVLGLSQASGDSRRYTILGLAMSLGVVMFWAALGTAMASISEFTAVNQLFQQPGFTLGVGAFIAVMAVSMCGLFSIQLPSFIYQVNPRHDTLWGSFFFGIMTAVLSTPCTAPFMGAALGWSTKQSAAIAVMTFLSIGIGMAFPYFILAFQPHLVNKIPRNGRASELVKQVMGLLMLAAAAYFFGVGLTALMTSPGKPPSQLYWLPVLLFIAVAGGWLTWRSLQIIQLNTPRFIFAGLGVVMVGAAVVGGERMMKVNPIQWVYYTPQHFQQAVEQNQVIVMDFTAEWCLNCKALEESVLSHPAVVRRMQDETVTPMKVDLTTGQNQEGNAMLARMDRLTIPLLVIFNQNGEPVFKSDFYTVEQLTNVLDQVTRSPAVQNVEISEGSFENIEAKQNQGRDSSFYERRI